MIDEVVLKARIVSFQTPGRTEEQFHRLCNVLNTCGCEFGYAYQSLSWMVIFPTKFGKKRHALLVANGGCNFQKAGWLDARTFFNGCDSHWRNGELLCGKVSKVIKTGMEVVGNEVVVVRKEQAVLAPKKNLVGSISTTPEFALKLFESAMNKTLDWLPASVRNTLLSMDFLCDDKLSDTVLLTGEDGCDSIRVPYYLYKATKLGLCSIWNGDYTLQEEDVLILLQCVGYGWIRERKNVDEYLVALCQRRGTVWNSSETFGNKIWKVLKDLVEVVNLQEQYTSRKAEVKELTERTVFNFKGRMLGVKEELKLLKSVVYEETVPFICPRPLRAPFFDRNDIYGTNSDALHFFRNGSAELIIAYIDFVIPG